MAKCLRCRFCFFYWCRDQGCFLSQHAVSSFLIWKPKTSSKTILDIWRCLADILKAYITEDKGALIKNQHHITLLVRVLHLLSRRPFAALPQQCWTLAVYKELLSFFPVLVPSGQNWNLFFLWWCLWNIVKKGKGVSIHGKERMLGESRNSGSVIYLLLWNWAPSWYLKTFISYEGNVWLWKGKNASRGLETTEVKGNRKVIAYLWNFSVTGKSHLQWS